MIDNIALQRALASNNSALRVGMPAEVVSYNSATYTASIRVVLPEVVDDGSVLEQPIIYEVPVMWPSGGGGVLSFPLNEGDQGWALFADRDISGWINGNLAQEQGERTHALNDAVFFPCFPAVPGTNTGATFNFAGSSIELKPDGTVSITPASGFIELLGNVTVLGTLAAPSLTVGGIPFATHRHPHGAGPGITGGAQL